MNIQIGKILIIIGVVLILAGCFLVLGGNKIPWLGHLPGDIRIEKENFKIYFPITTMVLISLLLSIILFFIRKIF